MGNDYIPRSVVLFCGTTVLVTLSGATTGGAQRDASARDAAWANALTFYEKGMYNFAISFCDEAIDLDPQFTPAYMLRGTAFYNKGDYTRAIADYGKVIQLNSDAAPAYRKRGNAYYTIGDYQRAISDYDKAIALYDKAIALDAGTTSADVNPSAGHLLLLLQQKERRTELWKAIARAVGATVVLGLGFVGLVALLTRLGNWESKLGARWGDWWDNRAARRILAEQGSDPKRLEAAWILSYSSARADFIALLHALLDPFVTAAIREALCRPENLGRLRKVLGGIVEPQCRSILEGIVESLERKASKTVARFSACGPTRGRVSDRRGDGEECQETGSEPCIKESQSGAKNVVVGTAAPAHTQGLAAIAHGSDSDANPLCTVREQRHV